MRKQSQTHMDEMETAEPSLSLEELVSSLQMHVVGRKANNDNKPEAQRENKKEKKEQESQESPPSPPSSCSRSQLFTIKEKDKLLWAFYIMLHGEDAYKYLKTKFVADKEIRITSVEKLHKMSNVFKQHKLNKSRIEAELSSDAFLTLEGFFGLCIIHNLSAMFIRNNCYCELYGVGDSENPHLIEESEHGIGIHVSKNKNVLSEMARDVRKTKWKMENVLSPIKSISAYTHSELLEIYNKVMVLSKAKEMKDSLCNPKEKKTKQYLYDFICKQLG